MFGFREFWQQNFPQPGAIWEGGRVRPKKFVTIGNRISHDHSWGSEVTEGLLKGHYFFAPFPQSQRMQFTHLIRHKLTLFGRGPDRKWTTLNGVTLAILWVPKMALRLQSKFRDNFLIQTSPPNPQKDTLGSRIGPKKTSKLFPRHFYCWRQKKLDNSKLGSTQQNKICWHWHVARIISSQKIYGLYARKYHIVEMRGDVTDAGRKNERTEDWASQPMEAGGWVSQ